MITQSTLDIRANFPDARSEPDGSVIIPECPVCRQDGHPNKSVKLFMDKAGRITGAACARFSNAGRDENRAHCKPILEQLGQDATKPDAFISETLFDGKLTLECQPAERGKVRLVARNCTSVLHRDAISLDKASDRAAFLKALVLNDDEQRQTAQALLMLADRYDSARAAVDEEEGNDKREQQAIFQALPDGRLAEQIAGGLYAVYDPSKREVTYQRKVESEAGTFTPLQDDYVLRGGLFLPERLQEYGDETALDAEIDSCIYRYADVPKRERKLAAKYIRLTYIADKLNEISYLRATGERGSGKSRFICTIGMMCLRPVLVTSPSAASLYRMMDAYKPTLTIDEANLASGSEDTAMLMQILNCGFQRVTDIPRIEKGADGKLTIKMFSPFGAKLIGGLKASDSEAFESRCVPVGLQKTTRKDIPFRMTGAMLRDFADVRAKLYLWRLRNWSRDYEQAFDDAERELKGYQIEPRFVQIAIPVYGLMEDAAQKSEFAKMLETRTEDAASDKTQTFDGRLITVVHRLLFDVDDDGEQSKAEWRDFGNYPLPEDGKPIELASVEQITATINEGQPDKKKYTAVWIGRELTKLGFQAQRHQATGIYSLPKISPRF